MGGGGEGLGGSGWWWEDGDWCVSWGFTGGVDE